MGLAAAFSKVCQVLVVPLQLVTCRDELYRQNNIKAVFIGNAASLRVVALAKLCHAGLSSAVTAVDELSRQIVPNKNKRLLK